jgi:hypothetical protein
MSKHTPGPWTPWYDIDDDHRIQACGIDTRDRAAGIVEIKVLVENVTLDDADINDRVMADCQLIAAAPELLSLVQRMIPALLGRPSEGNPFDLVQEARALLAQIHGPV